MFPREHGGWAMLLIPYVIGVGFAASFGLEPVLFLLSIVLVFMASEPLGILIKARRAKNSRMSLVVASARRWLAIDLLAAATFSLPLVLLYQRWWLILFGVLGAGFLMAQSIVEDRKLDRTTLGEIVGAVGLSLSAPGAYYATVGDFGIMTLLLWLLTALHSVGSVLYINMRLRYRLARGKPGGLRHRLALSRDTIAYMFLLMAVLLGLSYLGHLTLLALVAFVPLVCKAAKSVYEAKPEISFRHLGLVELANSIAFAALLILSRVTM